jgi:dCMP deaminase
MIKHTPEKWDQHFMKIAKLCSEMSKDPSTKVGCVIRGTDKSVISTGFNGFPPEVLDYEVMLNDRTTKYKHILHAEENAIIFANKKNIDLNLCILYTTLYPCSECYTLIKNAGIKRIVTTTPTTEENNRWGESWNKVKLLSVADNITIDILPSI